jgi:SAM-dependent methyltransferase
VSDESGKYDGFALIYNRHWGPRYAEAALETLEPLLLSRIPHGARILDLCCGSGQTSRRLEDRGYRVTGIDESASLIDFAKLNSPKSTFAVADARHFNLPAHFRAAISLNDSLNHLLAIDDLRAAFRHVYACLVPGGVFVFDLNLAHKYETAWAGSMAIVDNDAACAVIASSDVPRRTARFDAAVFNKAAEVWTRKDVQLVQTWYRPEEVTSALEAAGFIDIGVTDRTGNHLQRLDVNKAFFVASKRS